MLSLRNKTYILLLLVTAGFLAVSYGLMWHITMGELRASQARQTEEQLSFVERLLHREMENLSARQSDWAQWDDTYTFISDRNEGYITSNLNDESLALIHVDIMAFVNNSGELVFGKQVYEAVPTEREIPKEFMGYLREGSALLDFNEGDRLKQGILTLSDTLLLVSAQPITMSDGAGARRGVLIFARYLDSAFASDLSTLSGLVVQLQPSDSKQGSHQDSLSAGLGPERRMAVGSVDGSTIGLRLLDNIFGNPSLILRVEYPARVLEEGKAFLWESFWYSLIALISYVSLLIVLIDYFLLRRIESMRRIARRVGVLQSGELPEGDVDDFSFLATVMMGAIKNIQDTNEKAEGTQDELAKFQTALDQSFDHMIITDPEGKILHVNTAAEQLTGYTRKEMIGQTPALWGRQMPAEFYKNLWDTIRLNKQTFEGEIVNRNKKGDRYRAQIRIAPMLDSQRRVLYFVGVERLIEKHPASH
ncbi:MAG: CHASE4 domain-containing protein [Candidatus Moraniibacteriota bacterium]